MREAVVREALVQSLKIEGALAIALCDFRNEKMVLGEANSESVNITDVARTTTGAIKRKWAAQVGDGAVVDDDGWEAGKSTVPGSPRSPLTDVLVTFESQLHLIRFLKEQEGFYLLLVLDKARGNIGMARLRLDAVEKQLQSTR
jgi:hypothetical protein